MLKTMIKITAATLVLSGCHMDEGTDYYYPDESPPYGYHSGTVQSTAPVANGFHSGNTMMAPPPAPIGFHSGSTQMQSAPPMQPAPPPGGFRSGTSY